MNPRRCFAVALLTALVGAVPFARSGCAQPLVAPTDPLSPAEEQKQFHLPPGFEIQLFAAEPQIHKPINLSFDSAGRLFVTDTLEYPFPASDSAAARDSVKILVDRDGDGRADDVTTFVDGLNIPLGVMPIPSGAIVYSIPNILRCLDTDGDGRADRREPLYANFEYRDTHGMVNSFTRGLDGWLYACHGFANTSSPQGSDGQQITMNSGNTFRMRIDGSHIEYFTHGQVNPFGLAFDPLGNLYSADCHTMPITMLLRGAYYPSFGKAHDGLGFGPTMIGHDHGSTGIAGVAYYAAEQFPSKYRGTVFVGNPVTHKVNHDRLKSHGSTYEAVDMGDFVQCDDPWFRPVNLQIGPDGAMYIADFYNRIIGHYEVPLDHPGRDRQRGRIWRIVYTGKGVADAPATAPPVMRNAHAATLPELLELLSDPNLTVRTLATHELVDRMGPAAVEPLRSLLTASNSKSVARVHGLWALDRLGGMTPELVEALAHDADRAVRVHAIKMLAERARDDMPLARAALADPDPFVRRAAADALGRHPRIENVKPLLDLWASTPAEDTHLIHVARMALRDQLARPGLYAELSPTIESDPAVLDRLAEVSLGVATPAAADFVWRRWRSNPTIASREAYAHHVARNVVESDLPRLFAFVRTIDGISPVQQAGLLRELGRATQERGLPLPAELADWAARLASAMLAADQEQQLRAGIELAQQYRPPVFDALARAAGPQARFEGQRRAAIDACVANDPARSVTVLTQILAGAAEPLDVRQQAATALGRINEEAARNALVAQLPTAPQRLQSSIALGLVESAAGGESLLAAIAAGKATPWLLRDRPITVRLTNHKLDKIDERIARLTASLPPRDERLRGLIDKRRQLVADGTPDLAQGAVVFQKHCAVCHRIGQQGAKIGPNLDGVGIRGAERLLEDVLDPNSNVDQAFRTTQIVSTDGRIITGLALREEGQVIVLADAQGKEIRLAREEIDQRTTSPLSLMPANVADLVSESEFVNLFGYLLAQREAAK